MNTLRTQGWRVALVASGITMGIAGPMHPDSDAKDSMREELATMTADERWVTGHTLIVLATVLFAVGLWAAYATDAWPARSRRSLRLAAIAVSAYVLETIAHLAAVVDREALANGEPAPVAFTHLAIAAVLYPVSGLAIAHAADRLGHSQGGVRRAISVVGIIAGLVHSVTVPLVLLAPDYEATPLFALAGMGLALWTLLVGVSGVRVGEPRPVREPLQTA